MRRLAIIGRVDAAAVHRVFGMPSFMPPGIETTVFFLRSGE
jgi:hypothetical protein